MALFPGAIPVFTGFTLGHTLSVDVHASQHNLEQAEIVNIATKIGTGSSTPVASQVLRGTGVGTSAWGQVALTTDVSGVLPVANGGTGSNNLTFPGGPDTLVGRTSTDTLTNKTLTTPTIASFTNAQHDHSNAVGGGSLNGANAITDGTLSFAELTATIFSSQVNTVNGANAGGGIYYYINLGGIKIIYGVTSQFTNGGAVTVTFPVGFFSTTPYYYSADMIVPGVSANQIAYITSVSSSISAQINTLNNSGNASATAFASYLFIGP